MTQALPAAMVAEVSALVTALWGVFTTERQKSLTEVETAVRATLQSHLPAVVSAGLQAMIQGGTPGAVSAPRPCPDCGEGRGRVHSWRSRTLQTSLGTVRYERPWYICRACHHGWSPVDTPLGVTPGARLSPTLHEWCARLGARLSFDQSTAVLAELTGIALSHETLRQHAEAAGAALEAAQQQAITQVGRTQAAAESVEPAPGTLVVSTDGVMVRYRTVRERDPLSGRCRYTTSWHEAKVGVIGGQLDGQLQALSYVAAREPAATFGHRLLAEAARRGALEIIGWAGPRTGRGLAILREIAAVGDGAPWIWELLAEHFGRRIEILDFYHASAHLWDVAHAIWGPGHPRASAWATRQRHAMRTHGAAPVRRALARLKAPTPEAAAVLRRERAYVRTHAARMAYPTFAEQGLPLASGAVEGFAKSGVQQRMKLPGAQWSEPGAQAILTLRCHLLSHRPLLAA